MERNFQFKSSKIEFPLFKDVKGLEIECFALKYAVTLSVLLTAKFLCQNHLNFFFFLNFFQIKQDFILQFGEDIAARFIELQ